MAKTVTVARSRPVPADDEFVRQKPPPNDPGEPLKRITVDVPISLHTLVKVDCAARHTNMATEIKEMIERRWRPTGQGEAA
jgi:hypothetical protein